MSFKVNWVYSKYQFNVAEAKWRHRLNNDWDQSEAAT